MSRFLKSLLVSATLVLPASAAWAGGDAAAGEKVYKKCAACHMVGPEAKHKVGPELNDVIGRTAGTVDGYRYSGAMREAGEEGLVWTDETLAAYLANPRAYIKKNRMAFSGLKKDDDVADVIAYLKTFSTVGEASVEEAADTGALEEEASAAEEPAEQEMAAAEPAGPTAAPRPGHGVFHLGRRATDDEIAAWDIDIRPDGLGLPKGRGTVAQGEGIYEDQCAVCHGDFGEAVDRWPVLAGGQGTLTDERPVKTIGSYWPYLSTVYDYVRRAMPFGNAQSLSDDDVYAITAYLLYLNDIVTEEDFELSDENFASIRLPNEDNFVPDDRMSEPQYADGDDLCMTDCKPGRAEVVMRARVLDVTPDSDEGEEGGGGID